MNTQNPSKQLGYTLIELSIGLAVISMVLAGSVAGVQKIMEQVNLTRTVTQITTAAEKIRLIIKRDGDTSFVTLQNVTSPVNNAFATSNVLNPGATDAKVFNALGNEMSVQGAGSSVSSNQNFRIYLNTVSPSTCAELAGALEGIATSLWVYNNGWQLLKSEQSALAFTAANARSKCVTNGANYMWIEFLK